MAKGKKSKAKSYEVDYEGYEEKAGSGYDGPVPKRGIYNGALIGLFEHTSSDTSLGWIFEITEGDYKGWRGWSYSDMDNAKWKTQQTTKAINGGSEDKFTLQPAEDQASAESSPTVKKAKPVRLQLARETYEDEPRAKIRRVLPMEDGDGGKKGKGEKGKKKKKGDDPF